MKASAGAARLNELDHHLAHPGERDIDRRVRVQAIVAHELEGFDAVATLKRRRGAVEIASHIGDLKESRQVDTVAAVAVAQSSDSTERWSNGMKGSPSRNLRVHCGSCSSERPTPTRSNSPRLKRSINNGM